jgi:3-hydroxyisobutyrate dehydrogenase
MQPIAFLGLGLMGSGMAQNLLKAGYPLTVFNRTRAHATPFGELGAQIAETPKDAAQGADVIISMVADDHASRAVWLGEQGALAGAKNGALFIESSTLSTNWVRELAALAAKQGCAFLDAPVVGSKMQAAAGELIFFVGGDEPVLERARPVLEAMGKHIHHLGPTSSGATIKLVINLMLAVQIAVFAEGLSLAERAGLNPQQVGELLIEGLPGSPIIKRKAPQILKRDYATNFALRWMHKDLTYALDEAARQTVPLPLVATAREIYRLAMARGFADQDFTAVAEALRPKDA